MENAVCKVTESNNNCWHTVGYWNECQTNGTPYALNAANLNFKLINVKITTENKCTNK